MTTEQRVIEFHTAFSHPVRDTPQTLCRTEAILAFALIEEELRELAEALFPGITSDPECLPLTSAIGESTLYEPNLIEIADAIGDLDVVVNGAGIRHGLCMESLSREVFRSNMSKLGADGKPLYHPSGKIAKGPGFAPPNIAEAIGL